MSELLFPRGGKKRSTPEDEANNGSADGSTKSTEQQHTTDHLFNTSSSDDRRTKRTKTSKTTTSTATTVSASSPSHLGGGNVTASSGKRPAIIESIGKNKLGKNYRLLSIVKSVSPDLAVLSLPNMLSGYVRRGEGERALDGYLSVGDFVGTKVINYAKDQKGTRIEVRKEEEEGGTQEQSLFRENSLMLTLSYAHSRSYLSAPLRPTNSLVTR